MKRLSPGDLAAFCEIARHRSFRRAAAALEVTPSALSHALRALEERLQVRLVNRTTRSVSLTEAGQRLAARVLPLMGELDAALDELDGFRGAPSGLLRINTPRAAARLVLVPLIARFLAAFPDVRVELAVDDRMVDIVAAGFDAGVRFTQIIAADMVAVPIGPRLRSAVVARPDYFERHARPATPHDLHGHACIRYRFEDGSHYRWEFERADSKLAVEVDGPLTLCDEDLMVDAALDGAGLAYVYERQVAQLIAEGRLTRVLDDWCADAPGFYLYYPSRKRVPSALSAFLEFARADRDVVPERRPGRRSPS